MDLPCNESSLDQSTLTKQACNAATYVVMRWSFVTLEPVFQKGLLLACAAITASTYRMQLACKQLMLLMLMICCKVPSAAQGATQIAVQAQGACGHCRGNAMQLPLYKRAPCQHAQAQTHNIVTTHSANMHLSKQHGTALSIATLLSMHSLAHQLSRSL